jgi:iron-sulfur cluster repair protein YtfE (RIC family)
MSYRDKLLPETLQLVHHLMTVEHVTPVLMAVLHTFVREYRKELLAHFEEEEAVLFPYALALHGTVLSGAVVPDSLDGYSSEVFVEGHQHLNDSLGDVRAALRGYCVDHRRLSPCHMLLHQLRDMEKDLRVHELIEERVLVPKLRELESRIGHNSRPMT